MLHRTRSIRPHRVFCRFSVTKRSLVFLVLGVSVLVGCTRLTHDVITPEVYLSGIELLESGLLEQRIQVDLNVVNPNRFGVTVSGIDFVLNVNDQRLVSGRTFDAVSIAAGGESVVSVIARTGVVQILRQLMALPGVNTLNYELTGEIELGRFLGKTFPFNFKGQLDPDNLTAIMGGS